MCAEKACSNQVYARNYCKRHYQLKTRHGELDTWGRGAPGRPRTMQKRCTGTRLNAAGYQLIRVGPGDWQMEHRVLMEQQLGRVLLPDERIHHRNGDRADNRLENLELWIVRVQPSGQRVSDALAWAKEIIVRYA